VYSGQSHIASAAAAAGTDAEQKGTTADSRRASPLEMGGTLDGSKKFGKAPASSTVSKAAAASAAPSAADDSWMDSRWIDGRWDFSQFKSDDGETDWDAVIDAEVARRKALELNPTPSIMEDPVNFDTSEIPWWAWIRRFHLPEAELVNGRAAMIGYFLGYVVDALSGHGLVDQTSGFLGKTLIFVTIVGVCLVRNTKDIANLKGLADEATFYDKQWQATWEGQERPSETEQ